MKRILKITFGIISLCLGSNSLPLYCQNQEGNSWNIGVSKVNITPQDKIWMGGYAFRDRPADGKITDLWAKALYVEDEEGQQSVIVTLDLVGISKEFSDGIREKIVQKLGLSKAGIILNTSHTHSGPVVGDLSADIYNLDPKERNKVNRYADWLETRILESVTKAHQNMEPARLYSGNGITRFQVNRHTNVESTLTKTTPLNGPNDYAVPVLKVVNKSDEIKAVLFGYACHNTTLQLYEWSGDYAGFAQMELEEKYPGLIALFFQGAGGDQNPLPRSTISLARQYGKSLAAAVESTISEEMEELAPQLAVDYSEIDLPFEKESPSQEELIAIINDQSESAYPEYLKRSARTFLRVLQEGGAIMSSYPWYPVQVWNIGGQAIFSFGGELTVGYSVKLKEIFGENIFVMGYSNDVMSYIPTEEMMGEGGYEVTMSPVFTTPFSSQIEKIIIDKASESAEKVGVQRK